MTQSEYRDWFVEVTRQGANRLIVDKEVGGGDWIVRHGAVYVTPQFYDKLRAVSLYDSEQLRESSV